MEIKSLIDRYQSCVTGIERRAKDSVERAYGGIIRADKGALVEALAKSLVGIAWKQLRRDPARLSLGRETIRVPIKQEYIDRLKSPEVKKFVKEHIEDFCYPLRTDVHVHVDGEFKIAVECKAYTENAMLKRILVDFTLLRQVYPKLSFVLLQLESQLGGDYSTSNPLKYGSPSTHTLLSYFDIDLNIITLLEGERRIDQPIHKPDYYKPLREKSLLAALEVFKNLLR